MLPQLIPLAVLCLPATPCGQEVAATPLQELGDWLADRAPVAEPGGVSWLEDAGELELAVASRGSGEVVLFDGGGAVARRLGSELDLEPLDVAQASDGSLLVADGAGHRVLRLSLEGEVLGSIGEPGAGAGQLHRPCGIATTPELLAVADTGNDRIQLFRPDGTHLESIEGEGESRLRAPLAVALSEDAVFVADSGHHRVVVFDHQGNYLRDFGDWGFFPGLFAHVADVQFAAGHLWTCDAENHRVQVFSPEGELVQRFGLHALEPGEGEGALHYPLAMAVRGDGLAVAIAEPLDDRVQLLGPAGELDAVTRMRLENSQPSAHYGERLDTDREHLIVVEPETHELLVFDLQWQEPRLIARLGGYGETLGLMDRPADVHLDGERLELFVLDQGNRALHMARLHIDREGEVRFDPEMAAWVKRLDLSRLGPFPGCEAQVDPVALERMGEELFVLDARNGCVHVLRRDDLSYARSLGQLERGSDISADEERGLLWIVDRGAGQVLGLDPASGEERCKLEDFEDPYGVCVDGEGALWVSEGGARRACLVKLTAPVESPGQRAMIGQRGLERVQFHRPRSIVLDGAGRLIVLDHGNHRLQWLLPDGSYAGVFGSRLYTKPARLFPDRDPDEVIDTGVQR